MDEDIINTVHSILGKDVKVIDCEKTSSVREEEIILINGIPVHIEGDQGIVIRSALMTGKVPPSELLNQLLLRAGILQQAVQFETSLSVKSCSITKEEITVVQNGKIINERENETQEENIYSSLYQETRDPINKNSNVKTLASVPADECLLRHQRSDITSFSSSQRLDAIPHENVRYNTKRENTGHQSALNIDSDCNKHLSEIPLATAISNISTVSSKSGKTFCDSSKESISDKETYSSSPPTVPSSVTISFSPPCSGTSDLKSYSYDVSCQATRISTCDSIDSGHDGYYNSLIQSNCIPSVNGPCGCCKYAHDTETPSLHSNSISSYNDFLSISDEAGHHDKSVSNKCKSFSRQRSQDSPAIRQPSIEDSCVSQESKRRLSSYASQITNKSVEHQKNQPNLEDTQQTDLRRHQQQPLNLAEHSLVYRDGVLVSGPLNALIQHMIPTSEYYPDPRYIFAFLLSSRLFISPHELLAKMCHLCEKQQNISFSRTMADCSLDVVDESFQNLSCIQQNTTENLKSWNTCESASQQKLCIFARNFVRLLAEWMDTFPYDFRDDRLMQLVRKMTGKLVNIDKSLQKEAQKMIESLSQRLKILENYECFLSSLSHSCRRIEDSLGSTNQYCCQLKSTHAVKISRPSVLTIQNNLQDTAKGSTQPLVANNITGSKESYLETTSAAWSLAAGVVPSATTDLTQLCCSPTMLAQQLTHIELERLYHIGPEEFVQAFANENPNIEPLLSNMKKTRNLECYVQWFNRLSYLVATEIVKHAKKKQRVRVVEFWIETGRECFNIGNFNSLMAIIAGLNMSPISRLKKMWSKVHSAKFLVLEHQMDPSSNFSSYRSTLKAAVWRSAGATGERERIVIPFFSLLVKDLYFLNEGCANKLINGHINFEKFWQLAKQVTEFISWKRVTCPFDKNLEVLMFLQASSVLNENQLAIASFECEPPENSHEKDRYKCLKS